ncbi:carbohydrate kinase family protein [Cyclobacterium qasimii]|uniref:Fructokinase n=2 Tax=Cyclobacterium qasimii TaxID=1350429 RepID=S7X4J2_9BACT|nr:carbohydrate kinase [Cyclobacterium qasimii]EPR71018.1 Fructokinase [Cyclobacterium qasimii M12-11B]GEO24051.1 2-dehydro-3-deoxygluconokinase [Cyclobacterium qasimii]
MVKKIICFGEMLWDVFPKESIAGGAPMNVALHLQHLGLDVKMISKVGDDKPGRKLLAFTEKYGLNHDLIQVDKEFPTGSVLVDNQDKENIKYEIVKPVAWDHIQWSEEIDKAARNVDAIVFGSLAARNEESMETLFKLLEAPALKILDINLRPPYYTADLLDRLMTKADILKINEDELTLLADFYDLPSQMEAALEKLSELFSFELVCITLGSKGAAIYQDGEFINHPGYPVEVQDTVGSGDAFLAGFISKYLAKESPEKILDFACALGALVATFNGGTPQYKDEDIEAIKSI